ncbi:hypothetical protein BG58_03635 [Caballeronia jiangsuensis]|nr:hypothetical protein BG58_03635 [Caballeronia jiangsuensis]
MPLIMAIRIAIIPTPITTGLNHQRLILFTGAPSLLPDHLQISRQKSRLRRQIAISGGQSHRSGLPLIVWLVQTAYAIEDFLGRVGGVAKSLDQSIRPAVNTRDRTHKFVGASHHDSEVFEQCRSFLAENPCVESAISDERPIKGNILGDASTVVLGGEGPSFRVRLSFGGKTIEQAISGKGVLIACGEIPPEIAQQIQTEKAVQKMVEFSPAGYTAVDRWLKGGSSVTRAPVRRAESSGHLRLPEDRDKASGKR